MQKPHKTGCGFTMAFLIFLFVMGCLLFMDFRLVRNEANISWCNEADESDDEWELFDKIRVVKVKKPQ